MKGIIREVGQRLKALCRMYAAELKKLPKGSISIKEIKHGEYAYLAYRKKGRVHFDYIRLSDSEQVRKLKAQVEARRKLESLLKQAKPNLKEVERILRVRPN